MPEYERPEWGTEDYRRYAALFNDITHAPRHIMFSDRQVLADYLWAQGWRRDVRPEDVTENKTITVSHAEDEVPTCSHCGGVGHTIGAHF